jgi:hypothetical protein
VRTLQEDLVDVGKAATTVGRDRGGHIEAAEGRLLGGSVGAILVLAEQLGGDMGRDELWLALSYLPVPCGSVQH